MPAPVAGTYPAFFDGYIKRVEAENLQEAIEKHSSNILGYFHDIPVLKADYRYSADKWSIKEILQHIIDTERIFAYRALTIARNDKTPLPGFDEKSYASASNAETRTWIELLTEFEAVRTSTDLLLKSFTPEQLLQQGITNSHPNTTIAISFAIFGHILHHIDILRERYLK